VILKCCVTVFVIIVEERDLIFCPLYKYLKCIIDFCEKVCVFKVFRGQLPSKSVFSAYILYTLSIVYLDAGIYLRVSKEIFARRTSVNAKYVHEISPAEVWHST